MVKLLIQLGKIKGVSRRIIKRRGSGVLAVQIGSRWVLAWVLARCSQGARVFFREALACC